MIYYFKWIDASGEYNNGSPSTTYYEIEDNTATRQLMLIDGRYVGSNRKDAEHDYYLAEGDIDLNDIEAFDGDIRRTDFEEFELHWCNHLDFHRDEWENTKILYPLGAKFRGSTQVLYPQGVLFSLDSSYGIDFYSGASDDPSFGLYPGVKINCRVIGYDEVNMWLILEHL